MGAADAVPGVSARTMAFILGIYEELIHAIKSFDLRSLRLLLTLKARAFFESISWKFLLALGLGILMAIFTLARLLAWLLHRHHDLMVAFLTGLMLGSLRKIWPWKETLERIMDSHGNMAPIVQDNILPGHLNGEVFAAFGLMAAGFLVILILDRLARPAATTPTGKPTR